MNFTTIDLKKLDLPKDVVVNSGQIKISPENMILLKENPDKNILILVQYGREIIRCNIASYKKQEDGIHISNLQNFEDYTIKNPNHVKSYDLEGINILVSMACFGNRDDGCAENWLY